MRFALWITILCLALAGSPLQSGATPKTPLLDNDEKRLWDRAFEEEKHILESGRVFEDKALQEYLLAVIERLRPPDIPPHLIFKTLVILDPRVNGFAYPTGLICIHTGILAQLENEAQLAALLAHEMAHCIQKHSLRATRAHGVKPLKDSAPAAAGDGERQAMLSAGTPTAGSDFPHGFEREADRMAFELLVRAGYSAEEALTLFERLATRIDWVRMKESGANLTPSHIRQRQEAWEKALDRNTGDHVSRIGTPDVFIDRTQAALLANAEMELQAGKFGEALAQLERYLNRRPDDAFAHYLRGEAFRQRAGVADVSKALDCYRKAIALEPSLAEAYQKIGLIYFKEGKRNLARKAFETSLRLEPDSPDSAYVANYMKQCGSKM